MMFLKKQLIYIACHAEHIIKRYAPKTIKFAIVGIINVLVAYAVYVALVTAGYSYNVALTVDYSIGTVVGYILNRQWTFGSSDLLHQSFPRYVASYVMSYLLNVAILNAIVFGGIAGPLLGQAVALVVTATISFILQQYWVFRKNAADCVINEEQRGL